MENDKFWHSQLFDADAHTIRENNGMTSNRATATIEGLLSIPKKEPDTY